MKKYETPEMELLEIEAEDIMTASGKPGENKGDLGED